MTDRGRLAELRPSFRRDYEQLCRQFNKLERTDSYQGPQMEALVVEFLGKWEAHMQQAAEWPDEVRRVVKATNLDECTYYESLEDDLRLVQIECNYRTNKQPDSSYWNNYKQKELSATESSPSKLVADVYRRACEAVYLRSTWSKVRARREDDRREAVRLGQRAIRYDPHDPKTCTWYAVALGWYLDTVSNPREQTLAGETFKRSAQRCLAMEPREALAHHLLGIYFYHIGALNWFQRSFVKNFLGYKVEGGYAEAEREFRLSHECRDNWLPTGLWMAKVLLAQRKPLEETKHWIRFGLEREANEPTTELDRDELRELARKLKMPVDEGEGD